jgi:gamma-glutamyltranspeptidase
MAPTIVMDGDTLLVALGSPGSNRIPAIVASVISNMVDRHQGLRDAVIAPRVLWGGTASLRAFVEIAPPITEIDIQNLEAIGHDGMTTVSFPPVISEFVKFGGVNAVGWDNERMTFVGVGDPRRWGVARGPAAVANRRPDRHDDPATSVRRR